MKMIVGGLAFVALLLAVALVGSLAMLASQSRSMSVPLGIRNGRLSDCPQTPNCVSSDAPQTDDHYIAPIEDPAGTKWAVLIDRVGALNGARIVETTDTYARFEFASGLFGFVDDVELHRRPDAGQIAVRSASRVGRGDLNANRKRVEAIRRLI